MKRQRPGLPPLAIRLQVAIRQLEKSGRSTIIIETETKEQQLSGILKFLFGDAIVHLDHEPALRRRKYNPRVKKIAARYTPHAHDADCLLYRPFAAELDGSHYIKTQVRGDNGQFPDRVLIKRERRREKPKKRKGPPIQNRPWPRVSRHFQNRRP